MSINIYCKLIIVFAACILLVMPVEAKSHTDKLPGDSQEDLDLLKRLSNNPQLLNIKYLDCYLGPQASSMTAPMSQSLRSPAPILRTYWQDRSDQYVRYALEQSQVDTNTLLAEFSFSPTRQEDLLLKDVSKILGKDSINAFDENGKTAQLFQTAPEIKVFAYEDNASVNLNRISVQYAGPVLAPPSQADLDEATNYRRDCAFQHVKLGHHQQANSLLRTHLKTNPNDAEAHLKLAETYKAKSCLNEAIREYKLGLANCGDNADIRNRCLDGLHLLKVDLPGF